MTDVSKRVSYFDHQFLRAADLQDEQAYDLDRRRRHNRLLHQPGIAEGLVVTCNSGDSFVSVSPGTAYDALGQEIVLATDQKVDISAVGGGASATAYVTISYAEQPSDPSTDPGVTGNSTRVAENPLIAAAAAAPPNSVQYLLLAAVAVTGGKVSGTPDTSGRRQAGTALSQDATLHSLTLQNSQFPQQSWPVLVCDAANSAALKNAKLTLDAGHEVFFTDTGQVRSFDDSHRIFFNRPGNTLELREAGDIVFMAGGTSPTEIMRIVGASKRVGIGTKTPTGNLTVMGTAGAFANLQDNASGVELRLGVDQTGGSIAAMGNNDLQLRTNNATQLIVKADGNVGVGVQGEPAAKFDVAGNIHATNFPNGSDRRFKKNITPLTEALAKVERIQGVSFDWNEKYEALGRASGRREIGVVAQDVEKVCPELVCSLNGGHKAVYYDRMTALLVEAVKELAAENRNLKNRIERLEGGSTVRSGDRVGAGRSEQKKRPNCTERLVGAR